MGQQYGKVIQQLQVLSTRLDTSLVRTRQVPSVQPPRSDRSSEGGAGARDNPAVPPDGGATGSPGAGRRCRIRGAWSSRPGAAGPTRAVPGRRDNPAEPSRTTPFTGPGKIPMGVNFGPGIEFETLNEEYLFQIHNQTQIEGRFYQQPNQNPGAGGFDVPRERFIIAGRLSKPIEYDASLESAYGTVNLLNAFLNWHYDDRLMVKFGRYKVPYLYEYYAISNTDLLQPERSDVRRQLRAQSWGRGPALGPVVQEAASTTPSASSTDRGTSSSTSTPPRM